MVRPSSPASIWVVDTNVLVSGLLSGDPDSPTFLLVSAMLSGELRFLVCIELLAEYRVVLLRRHVRKRHNLVEADIDQLLHALADNAVVVDISDRDETAPDRGDDHLWRLLASRRGTGLISGDAVLLQRPPPGVPALSPREWIRKYYT